ARQRRHRSLGDRIRPSAPRRQRRARMDARHDPPASARGVERSTPRRVSRRLCAAPRCGVSAPRGWQDLAEIPPPLRGGASLNRGEGEGMAYWLMKSEPSAYSWDQLVKDKRTNWSGVRNFQAAANLKAMKTGDHAFFYHSNEGLAVVGIAEIVKTAYPDP